ncbi:MAG: SpoIID/LytB domain-containing protein [Patescibacteria group bacterium]
MIQKLANLGVHVFFVVCFTILIFNPNLSAFNIFASHCGADLDCQIQEIQTEINALKPAHENNKKELSSLNSQLTDLKKKITSLSSQLTQVEKDILKREEDLAYANEIFNQKAKNHYQFIRTYDPLAPFLNSQASGAFREIVFRQKASDEDRKTMEKYGQDLLSLKTDKEKLEKSKASLAALQKDIDAKAKFLGAEVNKVESYIATLSAKQNELSALKAGGFATSVGDTPGTAEPCSGPPGSSNYCDPGFRPAFAGFSFGAPHRTGMSQYGAYGRSKSGQSAETILAAYYQGAELNKSFASPANITVVGIGTVSFEDNYMLGIYEVPESWGDSGGFEALKAQAVAARSYALYYTNNGTKSICTTEACQVYKSQLKSGKWAEAVRATRGWVMTKGGSAAGTYFASTSGGYTISQWGWNGIKDAAGDWPATAYEKTAGSPWFYKGWYKSRGGATCGRNNPWLTSGDLADILNAWKVLTSGGGDVSRISPLDTGCWGGNPYSKDELKAIGGFDSVSAVSVIYSNSGSTQSVSFSTNKGSANMTGEDLKKAFNLRAPGYIGIKSSLFNIEKL